MHVFRETEYQNMQGSNQISLDIYPSKFIGQYVTLIALQCDNVIVLMEESVFFPIPLRLECSDFSSSYEQD